MYSVEQNEDAAAKWAVSLVLQELGKAELTDVVVLNSSQIETEVCYEYELLFVFFEDWNHCFWIDTCHYVQRNGLKWDIWKNCQ